MDSNFNWKPYFIGATIIAVISCIFSWKVGFGIAVGSIFYYLNDRLNLRKFPRLDSKTGTISRMFLIMAVQGILIITSAAVSWFVGKIPSFIACFVAVVAPTIYFVIISLKIK